MRTLEEALVELGEKRQKVKVGSLWRHRKTGTVYVIKDLALVEADLSLAVSYKELGASKVHWIRPFSEFLDGRFEKVVR